MCFFVSADGSLCAIESSGSAKRRAMTNVHPGTCWALTITTFVCHPPQEPLAPAHKCRNSGGRRGKCAVTKATLFCQWNHQAMTSTKPPLPRKRERQPNQHHYEMTQSVGVGHRFHVQEHRTALCYPGWRFRVRVISICDDGLLVRAPKKEVFCEFSCSTKVFPGAMSPYGSPRGAFRKALHFSPILSLV